MLEVREARSLGDLFSDLSRGTSTLIRQEVQLAKAEVSQKVSRAGKDVAILAVGGVLAYAGFLALIAAAILGLSEFIAGWLAALIIGLLVVGVGYGLVQKGLSDLKNLSPAPEKTIKTLKEDKEWVMQQIK